MNGETIDLPADDPVGGPYCRHVMVAAWCAICLGHDEVYPEGLH